MDQLPHEMLVKIFAFLDLSDLAKCRLLCKSLKCATEDHLKGITRIRLQIRLSSANSITGSEISQSLSEETFLTGPFVLCPFNSEISAHRNLDRLFVFLGQFCPNIQVVDAVNIVITVENLSHVANSLQFFKCREFKVPIDSSRPKIFRPFKELQAFDEDASPDSLKRCLAHSLHLFNHKKPIFKLLYPLRSKVSTQLFNLISLMGVKSLKSFLREPFELHPMPLALAQNLLEFSIDFTPDDLPVPSGSNLTFSKVQYLTLANQRPVNPDSYQIFFSSPDLKHFTLSGSSTPNLVHLLFTHFHSLRGLKVVHLELQQFYSLEVQLFNLQLPPSFEQLTLTFKKGDVNFGAKTSSTLLKFLTCNRLVGLNFDFPNLKTLKATTNRLSTELVASLSKCSNLELLFLNVPAATCSSELFDSFTNSLGHMVKLTELIFFAQVDKELLDLSATFSLNQHLIPSVKNLAVKLPFKIVFYPFDSFTSLELGKQFDFKGNNLDYKFDGKPVQIVFSGPMYSLSTLKSTSSSFLPEPNLVPNIKSLDLSLTSSAHVLKENATGPRVDLAHFQCLILSLKNLQNLAFHGSASASWLNQLLNHFESLEKLAKIKLGVYRTEGATFVPFVPASLSEFEFFSREPVDLSLLASDSLVSLSISDSTNGIFTLPNLKFFDMQTASFAPGSNIIESLRRSPKLASIKLTFLQESTPDVSYLLNLFQTLSDLHHLKTLHLTDTALYGIKEDQFISIEQSRIPSVTDFIWEICRDVTFSPLDSFDTLNVFSNSIGLTNELTGHKFVLRADEVMNLILQIDLDQLKNFEFYPFHLRFTEKLIHQLHHLKNIQVVQCKLPLDFLFKSEFITWVSSLCSLKSFTARPLSQEDLEVFLGNLRTKGPLKLNIREKSTHGSPINGKLRSLLAQLIDQKVICSFLSTWNFNRD